VYPKSTTKIHKKTETSVFLELIQINKHVALFVANKPEDDQMMDTSQNNRRCIYSDWEGTYHCAKCAMTVF
jgi:hypothetical protein